MKIDFDFEHELDAGAEAVSCGLLEASGEEGVAAGPYRDTCFGYDTALWGLVALDELAVVVSCSLEASFDELSADPVFVVHGGREYASHHGV